MSGGITDRGLIVGADVDAFSPLGVVPRGSRIASINGVDFTGMTADEIAEYFRLHRLGEGDVIRYYGDGDSLATVVLGDRVGVVRNFRLLDVLSTNAIGPMTITSSSTGQSSRTTMATASSRVWLKLTNNRRTPNPSANFLAFPWSRISGLPSGSLQISISCQENPSAPPVAMALTTASLAAKRAAKCSAGYRLPWQ